MRRGVPVAVLLCLFGARAEAGAWLRSEAESYYNLRLEYSTATTYWDRDGKEKDLGCKYDSRKINNYYEYGYSYYYTFFAELPIESVSCGAESVGGAGDLRLGVRGRLDPHRNGRAWEAILIVPTGYSTAGNVRLGTGNIGVELGLAGRDPFGTDREIEFETGAVEYGAGLRLWAGDQRERFFAYLQGTYLLTARWLVLGRIEGEFTINGGDTSSVVPASDRGSDFKRVKGSIELKRTLSSQWSATFGASEYIWGENLTHSRGGYVALSRVWR